MSPASPTSPPDSPSPSSYRITPAQSVGSSSTESEVSAYTVATTVSLGNDKPEMEPSGPPAVQFPSEQTQEAEPELIKGTGARRAKRKISLMNLGSKDKNKSGRGSRIGRDTKAQLTNQQNSEEEEEVVISITSSQYPEKDIASSREQEPASPASTAEFGSLTVPSRASYHDRPDSLYSDSISRTPSPSRSNFCLSNSPNSSKASFNTQQSQSLPTPSKSPSPSSASSPLTKNEKRSSKSSFRSLFSSFSKRKKHRRDESEVQPDDSVVEILDIQPETNYPPRKPMIQARMERSPRARKAWNFDNDDDDDELEPPTSPNPRPAVAETSNPPEEPKLPEESVSSQLPDEKDSVLDPEMSRQSFEEPLQQPPSSDFYDKNLDPTPTAEKSDQAPVLEDISSGESFAPSTPRSSSPDTLQSEVMTIPPPPSARPPRRERVRRTVRISSSKPGAIFSEPPQFRLPELSSPSVSTQMPAGVRRVLERTLWKVKAAKVGGSPNSNKNTTPIPPSAEFNAAMRALSSNRSGNSTSLSVTAIQPGPAYPRSVAPLPLFSEGEDENESVKKPAVFDQCRSLEISVHRLRIIQRIRTRIDGGMVPQDEIELEKYPDTTSALSVATGNDAWSGVNEGVTSAEIARKLREYLEKPDVWGKRFLDDYRLSLSAAPRPSFTDPLLGGEASDIATSDTLPEKDALGNRSGSLKPTKAYTIPQHRKPLPPPPVKSTNSRLRLIPPHADPCALGVWGGRKPFYERCAVWIPFDTEEEDAFESADLSTKLGGLCGLKVARFQVETGGRDSLTFPQSLREGFTDRIKWSISLVTRPQGEVHPTSPPGKPNPEDDGLPSAMLETTEEEPSSGKRKNSSSKLESVSLPPSPTLVQPTKNRNASLPGKTDPNQAEDDVLEVLDLGCGEGQPELEGQSHRVAEQEKQEADKQATKAASSSVRILQRAQSHTLLRSGSMSPLNSDGRKSTPLLPSPNSLKRDEPLGQNSLRHKSSMSGTWRYQVQPPIDSRGHARGQSAQLGVRNWQRPNPSPPPSPIRNGLMRGLPPSPVNQHGQPISRLQVKKTGQPRPLFLPQHVKHASVSGSGHSTQLQSMGNRNQTSHNFQSSLPGRGGSLRTSSRPAPVDGTRPSLIPRASAPVLSSGSS